MNPLLTAKGYIIAAEREILEHGVGRSAWLKDQCTLARKQMVAAFDVNVHDWTAGQFDTAGHVIMDLFQVADEVHAGQPARARELLIRAEQQVESLLNEPCRCIEETGRRCPECEGDYADHVYENLKGRI